MAVKRSKLNITSDILQIVESSISADTRCAIILAATVIMIALCVKFLGSWILISLSLCRKNKCCRQCPTRWMVEDGMRGKSPHWKLASASLQCTGCSQFLGCQRVTLTVSLNGKVCKVPRWMVQWEAFLGAGFRWTKWMVEELRDRKSFAPLRCTSKQSRFSTPVHILDPILSNTQSHQDAGITLRKASKSHLQAVSEWCGGPRSWCGTAADQAGGRGKVRVPHCPHCPTRVPPSSLLLLKVADLIVHRLKVRQWERWPKVEPSCSHEEPCCCCSHISFSDSLPSPWRGCLPSWGLRTPPIVEQCGEHGGEWGEQGGGIVATVSKLCDSWHPDMSILSVPVTQFVNFQAQTSKLKLQTGRLWMLGQCQITARARWEDCLHKSKHLDWLYTQLHSTHSSDLSRHQFNCTSRHLPIIPKASKGRFHKREKTCCPWKNMEKSLGKMPPENFHRYLDLTISCWPCWILRNGEARVHWQDSPNCGNNLTHVMLAYRYWNIDANTTKILIYNI